jgi:hypothetical protein
MGKNSLIPAFMTAMLSIQPAFAEEAIPTLPIHDGHTFIKTGHDPKDLPDGRVQIIIRSNGIADLIPYNNADRIAVVEEGRDPDNIGLCPAFNFDPAKHTMQADPGFFPFDITVKAKVTEAEKKAVKDAGCLTITKPQSGFQPN